MGKLDESVINNMFLFLEAQKKAEENGKEEFTCPICGGKAIWGRATGYNNHLHTRCNDCGFAIME